MVSMSANWQRRWQPLLRQWVIISASSAKRPWSGEVAVSRSDKVQEHDPNCYLCPGVTRANGSINPDYIEPFAFDNDFPALSFTSENKRKDKSEHKKARNVDSSSPLTLTAQSDGKCRVLCWSPMHDTTLANMPSASMYKVVKLWQSEYKNLAAQAGIENILIFENKGTEIGVSNLHPHGQIYATSFVTDTANRMRDAQSQYAVENNGASLLQDLRKDVHTQQELLVEKGQYFSVLVPFAARFAYETWIVPHRHVISLADMHDDEIKELGMLYQTQVRRYDQLFQRSAPNITLLHNAPCDDDQRNQHWCFHLVCQPPLRDTEKLKYLAGFESGSNNIVNPVQPELAASELRDINMETIPG